MPDTGSLGKERFWLCVEVHCILEGKARWQELEAAGHIVRKQRERHADAQLTSSSSVCGMVMCTHRASLPFLVNSA